MARTSVKNGKTENYFWNIFRKEFGYDVAINYKTQDVKDQLAKEDIHAYFDNVGGKISDDVSEFMVENSNIILCGQISQYNKNVPYPPPISDTLAKNLKAKSITRDRFLVLNYMDDFDDSLQELIKWMKTGKLKTKETIIEGIEHTGKAFVDMMNGSNIGKQLVKIL